MESKREGSGFFRQWMGEAPFLPALRQLGAPGGGKACAGDLCYVGPTVLLHLLPISCLRSTFFPNIPTHKILMLQLSV